MNDRYVFGLEQARNWLAASGPRLDSAGGLSYPEEGLSMTAAKIHNDVITFTAVANT